MRSAEQWYHSEKALMGASTNTKKATNSAIEAGIRYHRRIYKLLKLHCALSLPEWKLYVEPWFHTAGKAKLRSPDAVLVQADRKIALVIEVKKNWESGRDRKLLDEYLPIVSSAFGVRTFPLMLVGNVRGLKHEPIKSMAGLLLPLGWLASDPTPTLLVP
jgi:hypothetical protein